MCRWAGKLFLQQNMAVAVCSTGKGSAEVCGSYFGEDLAEHSHSDGCEGPGQICCPWPCHSISCGIWVSVLQVTHNPPYSLPCVSLFPPTRYSNIFVTSPSPENLRTLFDFVFRGFDALKYSEHEDYELVQSTNPEFNKAVVRVNIFREHRQTIQVCVGVDELWRQVFLLSSLRPSPLPSSPFLTRFFTFPFLSSPSSPPPSHFLPLLLLSLPLPSSPSPSLSFLTPSHSPLSSQYIHPGDSHKLEQAELVCIDEAAAIPLPLVKNLLGPYLVFMASTVNG